MHVRGIVSLVLFIGGALSLATPAFAQTARDPGVRTGAVGAGLPLPNLPSAERSYFDDGLIDFAEQEGVGDGLGPRFNLDGCGGLSHATSGWRFFTGGESASGVGHRIRRTQHGAVIHHVEWACARGTLQAEIQRVEGRRRARAVHHQRAGGCNRQRLGLQGRAGGFRAGSIAQQRDLPHSHAGIWHGPHRKHSG